MRQRRHQGFTLLEMSIVLVIIGLVIGGVSVGQTLINASIVRSQISQIEKVKGAVNAFKLKFGGLPGDLKNGIDLGFQWRSGDVGYGDGNGLIVGGLGGWNYGWGQGVGEPMQFCSDLSQAGMIEAQLIGSVTSNSVTKTTTPSLYDHYPVGKLYNSFLYVWSGGPTYAANNGKNYIGLSDLDNVYNAYNMTALPNIMVSQAYAIDTKLDDGVAAVRQSRGDGGM